jgi:hypothetical protein
VKVKVSVKVNVNLKVYSVSLAVGSNLVLAVRWNVFSIELAVAMKVPLV